MTTTKPPQRRDNLTLTSQEKYRGEYEISSQFYIEAEEVYRSLYKACDDRGLYEEASFFHHKDRIMRRYQLDIFSFF